MHYLEKRWKQLNLSNKEDSEIIVKSNQLKEEINKVKKSIIGKLDTDRSIDKEAIRNSMVKLQKLTRSLSVIDIHQNTFLFSFDSKEDVLGYELQTMAI